MSGNIEDVATIVSNLAFLFAAIQAWRQKIWILVMMYLLIIVNSSMYHTCNSFSSLCMLPSITHRMLDFFFAQLIIPATVFTLILVPKAWKGAQTMLFISLAFCVLMIQLFAGESIFIQGSIAIVSLALLSLYWFVYASYQRYTVGIFQLPAYDWGHFGTGFAMTCMACSLYASEMQYRRLYWAIHSCWHCDAAFGQVFLMLSRPKDEKDEYAVLDTQMLDAKPWPAPKTTKQRVIHKAPKSRI